MTERAMPAGYDALASDGRVVRIRPAEPADGPALHELYAGASDRSLYQRFFTLGRRQIPREVRRLTRPAGPGHLTLVAVDDGVLIGVAAYERVGQQAGADFAVLVADAHHGRGIGTLLLEELARQAGAAGVRDLVGAVLPANTDMLRVAHDLAPGVPARFDTAAVEVRIPTTPDEAALAAVDLRERTCERQALRPLLAPTSVAVVGAGRKPGGVGRTVLDNLLGHGFAGAVYPVNPHATTIAGRPAYPSLAAVPGPIDLALVAVPAAAVEAVLADAASSGIRAAVVLSAGFAETGPAGRGAQDALLRLARAHDIRVVGPNCLGVLNTDPTVRLTTAFCTAVPPAGGLAVASQSGAVGIAVLDHAGRTGIGVSSFVSLGNAADVSTNDLLAYWFDDPATRAVALYVESFGNPRRFARVARALARRKPVLAVKGGRSPGGRRAGASHTAAADAPDVAVDALFAQAGVVRTDTLGELLDAARLLADQPLPAGDRIGIVGNAAGLGVLAADAADAAGLTIPEMAGGNPADLGAAATPTALADAVTRLASGGGVDAVVTVFAATCVGDVAATLTALAAATDAAARLPVVVVLAGVSDPPPFLGRRRTPVFAQPEPAVRALGHAARYATWRRRPLGARPTLADVDPDRARALVDAALAAGGGWQPPRRAVDVLECYGITVVATRVARGPDAAADLGYPTVVKAADPAIVLGAGVVHDPLFGSIVMLGLGGIHTDLLGDRVFGLLPVTDLDAARLWRSLRGAPLLTGYRGAPPADLAALEGLLVRLGRLAEDLPEVAELDLNPLLAQPTGVLALDVKLRIAPVGAEPDPNRRALTDPR